MGPYELTKIKRHNRYEVKKIVSFDGPILTSTAADLMKPWQLFASDYSSGSDE